MGTGTVNSGELSCGCRVYVCPILAIFDLHYVLCYNKCSPAGHVIGLAHGASQHFSNGSWTKWRRCASPYGQDGSVQSAPTYFGRFVPTNHTFPQSPTWQTIVSTGMTNTWIWRTCVVFAAAACLLSAAIALHTAPDMHPDELIHGDAFCYFQDYAWPPPPNLDGLRYSPDGMSRVYNGEIVYWLWGRAGAVIAPLAAHSSAAIEQLTAPWRPGPTGAHSFLFLPWVSTPYSCYYTLATYRLLNTVLLALTLAVLLYWGRRHPWPLLGAALILCLPQVIYVYSYANSDAWGFSMSLFLFTFAVITRRPLVAPGSTLLLGTLTALVILSKQPFWITLPFS